MVVFGRGGKNLFEASQLQVIDIQQPVAPLLNLLIQGPGPTVVAFHGHLHRSLQTLAGQLHSTEKMLKTFLVVSNTKPFQNLAFRQANSHPVTFAAHINSYSNR